MRNFDLKESEVIDYPSHPEEPVSESAKHFNLVVHVYHGLLDLYRDRLDTVAIHANMSWYPKKTNKIWKSPDLFVAFGRPTTEDRVSYAQVNEEDIAPQVVFEMWSLGNSKEEMRNKRKWYAKYGVEEYYWINYDQDEVEVYMRDGNRMVLQEPEDFSWTSPRLGIRLDWSGGRVQVFLPDGTLMPTREQIQQRNRELAQRAEQEAQRAEQEAQRADRLEAELNALRRSLGLDTGADQSQT